MKSYLAAFLMALYASCAHRPCAQARESSEELRRLMRTELQRSMADLKTTNRPPPYFLGYWVIDYQQLNLRAELGAVVADEADAGRRIRVELRVGEPTLDNSNYQPADGSGYTESSDLLSAPDRNGIALRRAFWLASDQAYRTARELFDQKQAERRTEVQVEARPGDFSAESLPSIRVDADAPLAARAVLVDWIQAASKEFLAFPEVYESQVTAEAWRVSRTFVSSEGVESYAPETTVRFGIRCSTQAPDGMPLAHEERWFGIGAGESLQSNARRLGRELTELRGAEVIEDYSGPVLFEGIAGAQITQELLASSLSGTPDQQNQDGPLARRLGKRVLPKYVNVYDDPNLRHLGALQLVGHYTFDDEAVKPQRVSLVERGRLRGLLMSRTPRRGHNQSNGHGRSGLSGFAVGAVGNLVLESATGQSEAALRAKLLRAVREEAAAYGLVAKRLVHRGFATSGMMPPAIERAYKLYPDGREVLVRGASLGEMSLRDLRDILGVGRAPSAQNYAVVWPTGLWSPSSVVSPTLLFENVEVRRPRGAHSRPPVYSKPQ